MNFNSSHLIRLGDTILKAMPTFKWNEHEEIANVGTLSTILYEIQRNKRFKVRWMSRLGLSGKFQVFVNTRQKRSAFEVHRDVFFVALCTTCLESDSWRFLNQVMTSRFLLSISRLVLTARCENVTCSKFDFFIVTTLRSAF